MRPPLTVFLRVADGPSVTSVSALIAPALDAYVSLIAFEMDDQPYVFSRDPTRCQTSSQWSQYCKAIFKKWSGVACPPKMLRASFVTWLRNSEASPEILKQAARAQRHQKETADSDKYDKESNVCAAEASNPDPHALRRCLFLKAPRSIRSVRYRESGPTGRRCRALLRAARQDL